MFFVYSCKDYRVVRLGCVCVVWWFVVVLIWINDRVFCDVWIFILFLYLYCVWYVFIFIVSYIGCVFGFYFYVVVEFLQLRFIFLYWFCWLFNMGFLYIFFKVMLKDKYCDMVEQVKLYGMEKNFWV